MTRTDRSTPAPPHRLHGWLDGPVVTVALLVAAAGFGQFGAVAALGDVAEEFGETREGAVSIAEQAGLSGTALGVGLAVIRLASLASLPLAGAADRLGRRATLVWCSLLGLALTAAAALSPSYWAFVAIFALSRPLLTATDVVGEVSVAEMTPSSDRSKAIALVAAGYGVGSGLIAVVRGLGGDALGFRALFALALVPLVLVALGRRRIVETERFEASARDEAALPVLGAVARPFRRRVLVLAALVFAVAVVTGPANSFLFLYAENVLGLATTVTAALVVGAGLSGLLGLVLGRWAADRIGRRGTGAVAMAAIAVAGILTYSGSVGGLILGYLGAVFAGSAFAPAAGALHAELFPTSVRATVAGWLVAAGVLGAVCGLLAFGAIADAGDRFDLAALVVFVPAGLAAGLFWLVDETLGRELEDAG